MTSRSIGGWQGPNVRGKTTFRIQAKSLSIPHPRVLGTFPLAALRPAVDLSGTPPSERGGRIRYANGIRVEPITTGLLSQKQNVLVSGPPAVPWTLRGRVGFLPNKIIPHDPPDFVG